METTTAAVFDVASLVTALTGSVSGADILTLIGAVVGAGFGMTLTWFGARKLVGSFQRVLQGKKLSV